MASENDLSERELETIERHTNRMIAAAQAGREAVLKIPPRMREPQHVNNLAYWTNAVAALTWSLRIARQQCPAVRNVK